MASISTGIHIIRKRLKAGDRYYAYAWRGGPCIHVQDHVRPQITPDLLDKAYAARYEGKSQSNVIDTLINLYRNSPDFASKKPATQREYRHRLDQISARMGKTSIRHIDGTRLRGEIILWRDQLADTPRAADRVVGMLSTLFAWAQDRGICHTNPAKGIKHLHKVNRADLIWEERHWQAVADVPGHLHRALVLGSLTGLRISDLLALRWEQVTPAFIAVETQKTGGMATIPMHRELVQFLVQPGIGPVLRNTRCEQWTADGFQSSWRTARPQGFDRKLHDLRGTFATRLMIAGFTDPQIAAVMGWTAERIGSIRARYVDRERVARAMAEKMSFSA